jgi:hypothetical protein
MPSTSVKASAIQKNREMIRANSWLSLLRQFTELNFPIKRDKNFFNSIPRGRIPVIQPFKSTIFPSLAIAREKTETIVAHEVQVAEALPSMAEPPTNCLQLLALLPSSESAGVMA